MNNETLNNVRRIAYALYCTTGDKATMQQLARLLHYDQTQLERDLVDLENYTSDKVREDRAANDDDDAYDLNHAYPICEE